MSKLANDADYLYHHMGIPTTIPQANERYSERFKMYSTDGNNPFRIQWHRFEEGCPLHPLIQTVPHVAFKVANLAEALSNTTIIMPAYFPFDNYQCAMIAVNGAPIELIETTLTEDELWSQSV